MFSLMPAAATMPPTVTEDAAKAAEPTTRRKHKRDPRYKTVLCKNFLAANKCPYGKKCQFAHGDHELRQRPELPERSKAKQSQLDILVPLPEEPESAPGSFLRAPASNAEEGRGSIDSLLQLEADKAAAVQAEDYDTASRLKRQIDAIKLNAESPRPTSPVVDVGELSLTERILLAEGALGGSSAAKEPTPDSTEVGLQVNRTTGRVEVGAISRKASFNTMSVRRQLSLVLDHGDDADENRVPSDAERSAADSHSLFGRRSIARMTMGAAC